MVLTNKAMNISAKYGVTQMKQKLKALLSSVRERRLFYAISYEIKKLKERPDALRKLQAYNEYKSLSGRKPKKYKKAHRILSTIMEPR